MLAFDVNNYDINSEQDLAVDAAVVLKKREGRTIKSGGLWVYDTETGFSDAESEKRLGIPQKSDRHFQLPPALRRG